MPEEIKAIETRWGGYRFRSRTEARWAVVMNSLGIEFEYEHDGYVLPGGVKYLPDFSLSNGAILEVKGADDDTALEKPRAWAVATGRRAFVVIGPPRTRAASRIIAFDGEDGRADAELVECPTCGACAFHIVDDARTYFICRCMDGFDPMDLFGDCVSNWSSLDRMVVGKAIGSAFRMSALRLRTDRIDEVLLRGSEARFEFGESPEVR